MFKPWHKFTKWVAMFLPARVRHLFISGSPISKRERIIELLMFAGFVVAFCYFQLVTAWSHHLDAAFLMETLASIKKTGVPTSYLAPAFFDAFGTFTLDAESVCRADLIPSGRGLSVLDSHAYFILYPLAMFAWLFSPPAILAVANGLSFASIIFILYWVIRRQGGPILGAIAFCLLVMAHPAWSHASLGDFYADRFFMPLGLLYVSMLYDLVTRESNVSWRYWFLILMVGLLAAATTERAAIMIALFTIASLVLYGKKGADRGSRIILAIFSLGLLAHVLLYLKFSYVHYPGTKSLASILQDAPRFFERLQSPTYAVKVKEFNVINILFFGIFAIFDWRLALITFAALLPNLFTTIGGAELKGWATHYHSMYFPFLAFGAAVGYSKLWIFLGVVKYRLILMGLSLALIPAISSYSPGYGNQYGVMKRLYEFYVNGSQSNEIRLASELRRIAAAIPTGATVTTSEGFMPTLYPDRTIYYYPIGIDAADYAVLTRVSQPDGSFYYAGAVSYVGESKKVDMCLTERLKKSGFNVNHPRLLLGSKVVLERRSK